MTNIPAAGYFTNGGRTNAEAKDAQDDILEVLRESVGGAAVSTLTIATGAITPTTGLHQIDTEAAAAADDLDSAAVSTIRNGGFLILQSVASARVVTVKHGIGGTGQFLLANSLDLVLSDPSMCIVLQRRTNDWVEVMRSYGAGITELLTAVALRGVLSPAQITSNQNDYSPSGLSGASVLRLNTDAARSITGLAGGSKGRLLIVHNVGSYDITLSDESGSSTAANRFALAGDVLIQPDRSVILQYDSTTSRWRALAGGTALLSALQNWTKAQRAAYTVASSSSGTLTIDCSAGSNNYRVVTTENITAVVINNPSDGLTLRIKFKQGGAHTITGWNANVNWQTSDGSAPVLTATSGKTMMVTMTWDATDSKWDAQAAVMP